MLPVSPTPSKGFLAGVTQLSLDLYRKAEPYAIVRSHEGNSRNAAGGRCFVSNDALDGRLACSGDGVSGIRSAGTLRILRSLLATALQFSSPPRLSIR